MKQRLSNIELLRIIAMVLVLIVHADFAALGVPTQGEAQSNIAGTLFRYSWEALAICCVNVFVLISGWFGIRPTGKGFAKFVFQVLFFSLGLYAVACVTGQADCTLDGWKEALLCTHGLYWFIPAYVGLYVLSPVLNAFVKNATKNEQKILIFTYFVFQWLYGYIFGEEHVFQYGYSLLSFIGLYLLARFLNLHCDFVKRYSSFAYLSTYLICALLICGWGFAMAYYAVDGGQMQALAYNNPVVIIESVALLLCFVRLEFSANWINRISASCFAVFLLHLNPHFYFTMFKQPIQRIAAENGSFAGFGLIVAYLCGVFVLAIAIDQIRILLWRPIEVKETKK